MRRDEIIQRYKNIKSRWDADPDLRKRMPERYEEICAKLTALENGASFQVVNKTDELKAIIAYVGGQIPRCNFKAGGKLIDTNNGISWEKACEIASNFDY